MIAQLRIGWFRFALPSGWAGLSPAQARRLYKVLAGAHVGQPIFAIYRSRILALLPPWGRWLFWRVPAEEWVELRVLTHWAEDEPTPTEAQLPVISGFRPAFASINFGDFIRAEALMAAADAQGLAKLLYGRPKVRGKIRGVTPFLVWFAYLSFRQRLGNKFRHAFGGGGSPVLASQVGENWAKVLIGLAEKSTELEGYSQLPALTVLFELDTKMEAAKQAKKR